MKCSAWKNCEKFVERKILSDLGTPLLTLRVVSWGKSKHVVIVRNGDGGIVLKEGEATSMTEAKKLASTLAIGHLIEMIKIL